MNKREWTSENDRITDVYQLPFYPVDTGGGWWLERYEFYRLASGHCSVYVQAGDRYSGGGREFPIPERCFGGSFEEFLDRYLKIVPPGHFGLGKQDLIGDGALKGFLGFTERKPHPEAKTVTLPALCVIGFSDYIRAGDNGGKIRSNLSGGDPDAVEHLWETLRKRLSEADACAMREKDGSYVGFWGVMSGSRPETAFEPWRNYYTAGYYLAGLEVYADRRVPEGWEKWLLPARTYLVSDVTPEDYDAVFLRHVNEVLPEMGLRLDGGVLDYIEPASGKTRLFFPVRELK